MKLTEEIKSAIKKSVLCWLATSDQDNMPNVSPKEVFNYYGDEHIIIANIASPRSKINIEVNPRVCLSFVDILIQKGFQLKGIAEIVRSNDIIFNDLRNKLESITNGEFPFRTVIKIKVESAKRILAPRYLLYPETTEEQQIESAKKQYNI